jgi:hypothetical protein
LSARPQPGPGSSDLCPIESLAPLERSLPNQGQCFLPPRLTHACTDGGMIAGRSRWPEGALLA